MKGEKKRVSTAVGNQDFVEKATLFFRREHRRSRTAQKPRMVN